MPPLALQGQDALAAPSQPFGSISCGHYRRAGLPLTD
jgi:hypothetical protein